MGDRIAVMKDGVLQQFDTPQRLYANPCNLFVAGFIGSPQMNFVKAEVAQGADGVCLHFGGFAVPVPQGKYAGALDAYLGKTVVLGIRPEDIHGEGLFLQASSQSVVQFQVDLAELMGAEIYLYGTAGGEKMIARVPARTRVKAGDVIDLAIDINHIHLFDAETETVICQ